MTSAVPSTTVPVPDRSIHPRLASLARVITHIPALVWLIVSGAGLTALYWFGFGTRYSFAKYGTRAQQSMATLNNFSADGAFLFIASFVALFALYGLALRFGRRRVNRRAGWVVVGVFAVLMNLALLPMHIFDAVDVYDYVIRGRMSAIYGLNPMHDTPSEVPSDPFYGFAAWHFVPSAYGPAWERIASLGSRIAGDDNQTNVIVFKAISVIGYLITALFVVLTLLTIAPKRALLGLLLFAWNPLVVYMTGGGGHNDTLMTAGLTVAIYCLVRRWYIAGTTAALLGALIKFMPVLLIPIIAIVALRDLSIRLKIRYVLVSAVLCGALAVLFYGPFWTGLDTLGLDRRSLMYTGSVATLVRQTIAIPLDGHSGETAETPNADNVLKYVVTGLMGIFYLSELWEVFEDQDRMRPIRTIARVLLFYLLVACIWFQAWYVLWVLPLAAVLDNSPMRRLILLFSYLVTWQSFLYNYVTLRPPVSNWAPLPWRDLIPVGVVMGTAWAYVAWFWIASWLRRGARTPFNIMIGERLRTARLAANLPIVDLADDLSLRTDDLVSYECGDKAPPIDRAKALSERLHIDLSSLVKP
ncbi:MAG TPA: helix-turn-helix transcriptional regulator [Aggregatilineales bacterium]|nr:helix-turn-helix transcriptional regulator [Aggregatilineales bacterium]